MKKFLYYLVFLFLFTTTSNAQKIDTVSTFSITGYVDGYYAYYSDSVGPGNFQKWPNTSPRNNSPSLNTAMLSMLYNAEKVRAAAVFSFGDFAACTWAPAPYNNVMEAHVGFKVNSKFWIDAGMFRTHFGTEFLLPGENLTSSITVGTFYEPPFESGLRLNFDPTRKLEINLFLLNGYGMFVDNNNQKSFGAGVTYAINDNTGIGYTNYIGDDNPVAYTGPAHLRIHQNAFLNYKHKKITVQTGMDFCMQQNSDLQSGTESATMWSALATLKYQAAKRCAVYGRAEVFSDPNGIMSGVLLDKTGKLTGYKLWGATAGLEYKPTEESYIRLESRLIAMDKDQYIFINNGTSDNKRIEVMLNAGVTFDLLKSFATRKSE